MWDIHGYWRGCGRQVRFTGASSCLQISRWYVFLLWMETKARTMKKGRWIVATRPTTTRHEPTPMTYPALSRRSFHAAATSLSVSTKVVKPPQNAEWLCGGDEGYTYSSHLPSSRPHLPSSLCVPHPTSTRHKVRRSLLTLPWRIVAVTNRASGPTAISLACDERPQGEDRDASLPLSLPPDPLTRYSPGRLYSKRPSSHPVSRAPKSNPSRPLPSPSPLPDKTPSSSPCFTSSMDRFLQADKAASRAFTSSMRSPERRGPLRERGKGKLGAQRPERGGW